MEERRVFAWVWYIEKCYYAVMTLRYYDVFDAVLISCNEKAAEYTSVGIKRTRIQGSFLRISILIFWRCCQRTNKTFAMLQTSRWMLIRTLSTPIAAITTIDMMQTANMILPGSLHASITTRFTWFASNSNDKKELPVVALLSLVSVVLLVASVGGKVSWWPRWLQSFGWVLHFHVGLGFLWIPKKIFNVDVNSIIDAAGGLCWLVDCVAGHCYEVALSKIMRLWEPTWWRIQ